MTSASQNSKIPHAVQTNAVADAILRGCVQWMHLGWLGTARGLYHSIECNMA